MLSYFLLQGIDTSDVSEVHISKMTCRGFLKKKGCKLTQIYHQQLTVHYSTDSLDFTFSDFNGSDYWIDFELPLKLYWLAL